MRDWTISSSMLIDYILQLGDDGMNTDSLFHIPLRDSIIYTMLVCNEGFKKTKSAREIVNPIPFR